MNKKILCLLSLIFIFCAVVGCEPINLRNKNILFRQSFSQNDVKGINVNITSEIVQIDTWNKDSIQVVMYGTSDYPNTSLNNAVLTINTPRGNYHPNGCIVQIIVPERFYANTGYNGWKIETTSGDIYGTLLWGEYFSIKTTSGNIELSRCEAKNATITSVSGRISVNDCAFQNQTNVKTVSGSIFFFGKTPGINAETTSGAMSVKLKNQLTERSNFETISGSIVVSLPANSSFKFNFETVSGSVFNAFTNFMGGKNGNDIVGSGIPLIRAKSISGSIQILN